MKKRKLDDGVLNGDKLRLVVGHFQKLSDKPIKMVTTPDHLALCIEAPNPITTTKLRSHVRDSGMYLYAADFDLANGRLELKIGTADAADAVVRHDMFECSVTAPYDTLEKGASEDTVRIKALSAYAGNYLGAYTPELVKFEICDSKGQTVDAEKKDAQNEYLLKLSGWQTATLEQLEAFEQMFPFHIRQVEVVGGGKQVHVYLRGALFPLRKTFLSRRA